MAFKSQLAKILLLFGSFWECIFNCSFLERSSNNQNGNLRWIFPLGVRPPPLMDMIFRPFFYPTFFFCNWILHIQNGFYTSSQSKILLLSPLIIGSKLTSISSSGAWSNESLPMPFYRSTRSQNSCQIKFSSKNGWEISSSIFGRPLLPILHT